MASNQPQKPSIDRYVVIHVATTCDEHGVYVTKDSAEVIEIGWLLLNAKTCDEVSLPIRQLPPVRHNLLAATDVPRKRPCETR